MFLDTYIILYTSIYISKFQWCLHFICGASLPVLYWRLKTVQVSRILFSSFCWKKHFCFEIMCIILTLVFAQKIKWTFSFTKLLILYSCYCGHMFLLCSVYERIASNTQKALYCWKQASIQVIFTAVLL